MWVTPPPQSIWSQSQSAQRSLWVTVDQCRGWSVHPHTHTGYQTAWMSKRKVIKCDLMRGTCFKRRNMEHSITFDLPASAAFSYHSGGPYTYILTSAPTDKADLCLLSVKCCAEHEALWSISTLVRFCKLTAVKKKKDSFVGNCRFLKRQRWQETFWFSFF